MGKWTWSCVHSPSVLHLGLMSDIKNSRTRIREVLEHHKLFIALWRIEIRKFSTKSNVKSNVFAKANASFIFYIWLSCRFNSFCISTFERLLRPTFSLSLPLSMQNMLNHFHATYILRIIIVLHHVLGHFQFGFGISVWEPHIFRN